jgi:WD40 repeat protein
LHGIKGVFFNGSMLTRLVEELPDEILVLFWGVTSFTCLPLEKLLNPVEYLEDSEIITPGWILDARVLNTTTIGLVTAQNAFLTYSLKSRTFFQRFNCEQQSLLYAAQLYLAGENDIIVATGTVFNEIQLWRPFENSTADNSKSASVIPISKRLLGHEGCIFSLRFNDNGNLLASCSDDRTIRIWDIAEAKCLAIGFAHIARVWDVRFVPCPDTNDENIYLLSTSEDTSALLWRFSPATCKLKVQERYHGHWGKHVWSQDVSSDGTMAVTGGNDGSVNIWDIGGWKTRIGLETDLFWTEKSLSVTVDGKERIDPIKGCQCVGEDRLMMTTKSGYFRGRVYRVDSRCVYVYSLTRREFTLLFREQRYKMHSSVGGLNGMEGWVCLVDSKGCARLFNLDNHTNVCPYR